MCTYTQREYSCGHFRWIATAHCSQFSWNDPQQLRSKCEPDITEFEDRRRPRTSLPYRGHLLDLDFAERPFNAHSERYPSHHYRLINIRSDFACYSGLRTKSRRSTVTTPHLVPAGTLGHALDLACIADDETQKRANPRNRVTTG
ncbi:hypothetical protein VTJ04DRAFT_2348 [Mycothermus thermophilus]|uniref:uncharacterized protein n=1 Tax=Humicola insolens TaxID=85995 RepID=UPI003743F9AE